MNQKKIQGLAEADQARAELYDTLGQLRDRLDYAQRIDNSVSRAGAYVTEVRRKNPVRFAIVASAVSVVVGTLAWGIARAAMRK